MGVDAISKNEVRSVAQTITVAMANNNWVLFKKCMCPGYPEWKYRSEHHKGETINCYPTKDQFTHYSANGVPKLNRARITTQLTKHLEAL